MNAGTTVSTTYASAQTAGDTNIVVVSYASSPHVMSVTDSMGNVYVQAIQTVGPHGSGQGTATVYYAKKIVAASSNANTVTVTLDSSTAYVELSITEYSGIDTVTPLDVAVGAGGTSAVADSGTVTTTNANDLLFGFGYAGSWPSAPGTGYTTRLLTGWGHVIEDEAVTGTGNYNASATLQSSTWWIMQMVAFKASNDTQAPTAPANLTATATSSNQVNLAWTASTDNVGVAGYEVERCQGASCSIFAQIASPTITSYSDTGLSASTAYSYRVRAKDAVGNVSGYSGTASATTAAYTAPPIQYIQGKSSGVNPATTVSTTYTSAQTAGDTNIVVVSWYDTDPRVVSVTDNMGNVYTRAIQTAGAPGSYEGTTSVYYARNIVAAAANANTVTVTLDSSAPFVELSVTEYSGIDTVNPLDAAVGTTGISSVADSGYTTIANANDLLFGNAYVGSWSSAPGTGYSKRFQTYWGDGVEDEMVAGTGNYNASMSQQSSSWWIMQMVAFRAAGSQSSSDTTAPSVPTGLTATATSSTQINLTWTASADNVGVTGYKVERCSGTSCSTFAQIATPIATSFTDSSLTGSTSYSYRVRATDAAGNLSGYSGITGATTRAPPDTTAPTAPTGLAATAATSSQITLNWTASADDVAVTGYLLERCTGYTCSSFAQITTAATRSYVDTGLNGSTSYRYRVRATDAAGNLSSYSNIVTVSTTAPPDTTPPTAPTGVTATAYIGVIELTWTPSNDDLGISGYTVERCEGVGCATFAQIASVTSTSYDDPGLASSQSYSYRIRAIDLSGNLSDYSAVTTATTLSDTSAPTTPNGLTATTVSTTQINLAWSASTDDVGVTGYIIERCPELNCSAFTQIAISTATSYSDTGLTPSTSYLYRVVATDAAGNLSDDSNTANATTQSPPDTSPPSAPENLSATTFGPIQVNLSWIASFDNVGVTGYLIERCQGSGCSDFTQIATTQMLSYSDESIAAATNYSYRIRATDAANNLGDYSNIVNVATPYAGPITYTYSYDNLGRVTQAMGSDGSVITYTYDANGNVTSVNRQ